jgi:multisubunit Na+/H+ antiporter MnhB subunit
VTPLIDMVARLVLLPTCVVAAALVVKGYAAVGDGFSAGVLTATAVLLMYVVRGHREAARLMRIAPVGVRAGLTGVLVMLAVVFAGPVTGRPLLSHFPAPGGHVRTGLGIELHTALLFDLGIGLLVFGTLVSMIELLAELPEDRR